MTWPSFHTYTLLHREAPAEADFQRLLQVGPPAGHDMIVALERRLISRMPRQPRTIRLLLSADVQPIKITATRYQSAWSRILGNVHSPEVAPDGFMNTCSRAIGISLRPDVTFIHAPNCVR
jgi:hypothetical protein